MSKPQLIKYIILSTICLASLDIANAQIAVSNPAYSTDVPNFTKFKPQPQNKTQINYDIWNGLLEEMVLYTGPSTRKRMSRPQAVTGSKLVNGHISAYRLEGNRIPYSEMKPIFKSNITEYRKDLERIGTEINISKLSKNEQLSFWLNLHNVVIIEQLANEYPVRRPSSLKIGDTKASLHDAKIIKIKNSKLSLRDIRENIVYPNWQNPKVIYGFHLGDIGSPSIQNTAFNATNVSDLLDRSASEFTNSLRGFYVRNNNQYISKLYSDTAKYYFPHFDVDIAKHISKYMRDEVRSQLLTSKPFRTDRYDRMIADLTGGQGRTASKSYLQTQSEFGIVRTNRDAFDQYVQELHTKREALERQGLVNNGVVIIEDIPTIDPDSREAKDIDLEPTP